MPTRSTQPAVFTALCAVSLAMSLAGTGCLVANEVAAFEGELTVAPKPAEFPELYVNVQAMRSEGVGFGTIWTGGSLEPMALGSTPQDYPFSLVTEDPETDVHLRVRYCVDPDCTALPAGGRPDDPQAEIQFVLGHPFYVNTDGEGATSWSTRITLAIPGCVRRMDTACPLGTCNPAGVCEVSPGICVVTAPTDPTCVVVPGSRPTWRCEVDKCSIAGCVGGTVAAGYCSGDRHFCE